MGREERQMATDSEDTPFPNPALPRHVAGRRLPDLDATRGLAGEVAALARPGDVIALGGAMTFGRDETDLGRRFLEEVRSEVRRRAFPVPAAKTEIAYATLGGDAGFIGAAACARLASRGNAG